MQDVLTVVPTAKQVQAYDDNAYTEMDKFMATKCGQWYALKARKWNTLLTVNQ
jgi:hypothetical protein